MSAVVDAVRNYLAGDLGVTDAHLLDPEFPFIRRGVVDSADVVRLLMFLETAFNISVDETDVVAANIGSLAAIERFVAKKTAAPVD